MNEGHLEFFKELRELLVKYKVRSLHGQPSSSPWSADVAVDLLVTHEHHPVGQKHYIISYGDGDKTLAICQSTRMEIK